MYASVRFIDSEQKQQNDLDVFRLLWQRMVHVPLAVSIGQLCYFAGKVSRRQIQTFYPFNTFVKQLITA